MHSERIYYPGKEKVYLDCYVLNSGLKLGQEMARPAVVICPGGGYVYLSPREAEPVAMAYAAKGIHAFVLNYSLGWDVKGFGPLQEMDWAIGLIREHAEEWNVNPDKILACGFSAGGHLALSSGLLGKEKPNGVILGYPAINMDMPGGDMMLKLFTGGRELTDEERSYFTLSDKVTKEAPPLFMFTTGEDTMTRKMTLELAFEYEKQNLLYEYHVFQKGPHGYSLANEACADGSSQVLSPHAAKWFDMSVEWIFEVFGKLTFTDTSTSRIGQAMKELGIGISVVDAGDDVTKQVSDVEDLVAKGISVLIINPVDSDAVTGAVEAAMAKGVRVIAVDRAVNGVTIDCQIASDNVLGAELATQYIVDTLGEGIKVAELEGVPGASAAIDRSEGFHNVADAKLDVVAKQTANFDRAQGMSVMENMLQANGDIQAVFAANDEMALGALEAVAGAGKDIMVVGFDATDDAIAAIKEGRMAATIAQQPALIGSTAVENAVKLINGEGIAKSIPVEVTLVTKDNVE